MKKASYYEVEFRSQIQPEWRTDAAFGTIEEAKAHITKQRALYKVELQIVRVTTRREVVNE